MRGKKIYDEDTLRSYDLLDTPQKLSDYMYYLDYRWMDQNGEFHDECDPEMYTTFSLMTASEVLEHQCGICVDQVQLERDWFSKHGYVFEVLCIQLFRDDSAPGHVFLIYYDGGKWCWFENAWSEYAGIHVYNSRDELLRSIQTYFIKQNDILPEELVNLTIRTFPQYPAHMSYEQMDAYDVEKQR